MLLKFEELGGSRLDSGASRKLVKSSRVIVARRGVERAGSSSPSFFHARGFTQRQQKANGELASPAASASWEMRRKGGRRTYLWFPKVTPAIDITKRNKEIATDRKSGTKNLVAECKPRVPRVSHHITHEISSIQIEPIAHFDLTQATCMRYFSTYRCGRNRITDMHSQHSHNI